LAIQEQVLLIKDPNVVPSLHAVQFAAEISQA